MEKNKIMGQDEDVMLDEIEERLISEEFKIWKKNTPFLYNMILCHNLEWPSLTVEWLPDQEEPLEKNYSVQKMILGTYCPKNKPNYLMLAQVQIPFIENDAFCSNNDQVDISEFKSTERKVEIIQQINHEGEVNRARYLPQKPFVIATKAINGEVYLFDYNKHTLEPTLNGVCNPDLRLRGHNAEGYGLSWSKLKKGYLLSSGDDAQICLWDINATSENKSLEAMQIFKFNESAIEDVAWHLRHEYLFGSVGDDQNLLLWDLRTLSHSKPAQSVLAHQGQVNCLAFNPFNEWVVATASTDETVKLFDLRNITVALHTLDFHKEEVYQVGWNPKKGSVLASSCVGRRLMVWDLSRIGEEQTIEEAKEGPPELLFVHGGHISKIFDFSWNPCEDWVIASTAENNMLHIWQMAEHIYNDGEDLPKELTRTS